jgi:hypothetical protein
MLPSKRLLDKQSGRDKNARFPEYPPARKGRAMIPTPPPLSTTHEVLNQARVLENYNAYASNRPLQEAVRSRAPAGPTTGCWRAAPKSAVPSGSSMAAWPTSARRN